jgi:CubicO group peptidase (beta-lactamase class C family)
MLRTPTSRRKPRTWRAVAVALAPALAALSLTAPAHATPVLPRATFDPAETSWLSLRDASSTQFASRFDELKDSMMVIDLDVDEIGGAYRVGAVFRPNADGRGWYSLRNLTGSQFHAKWTELRDKGFRLVDQEAYVVDGHDRFAGVWIENREHLDWASYRGATAAEFDEKFEDYRDGGFLPVDVDVYRTASGALRYAAAWVRNADGLAWKLHRNRTSSQYGDAFQTYADQGLRSIVVDSARTSQGQRYAGIWVENRSKRGWYAYRDLTATGFRNRWNRLSDEGYRLDGYEKYDTASGPRYAGIWRQNSDRPNWKLRSQVDAFVEKELDDFDVPGISVTASKDGKVVYRRGFGYQDKADGVWMHGGSVNRTASVSKAVAGVLALRMDAKHAEFTLQDKVRTHLPWLPAKHDYTMEQAVMNRSCVKSYPSPMSSSNATQYDTSAASVKAFMDDDLGCTPGSYLYSTHAYEVDGAIYERYEGKPINRIVLDELTTKFGLDTLRPETLAGSLPDRVQLYNTDNSEYAGDNMSNKTLGGGLVSTAPDLVSFANKILDGTLLTPAQRTTLWSPIGSYAYGWDVGSGPAGQRLVGKAGGQPGAKSYLRVYPDDGIVVAVLSNRWKGGHSAAGLSKEIGEAMLAG